MLAFLIISNVKMLTKKKNKAIKMKVNILIMKNQDMNTMNLRKKTAKIRIQVRKTNLKEKMKIRMKMRDLKRMILKLRNRQKISKIY